MKSARGSGVDKISNLPCNVLDGILGCLSLKDAVKTSILSKNWRYNWVTRKELDFDDEFFSSCKDNQEAKTIIYQVLLFHEGPMLKFRLQGSRIQGPQLMSCLDINHWIRFLSKKDVREFTLRIGSGNAYHLPHQLFTCQQLRHLELKLCLFHPPPGFKGFVKLINLDLHDVIFVPSLISKCPLLERLRLSWCRGFDILEIDAPNLKCFHFSGRFKSICFKNAPVLREVTIVLLHVFPDPSPPVSSNVTKFFHYMPSLQTLDICGSTLEYLTMGGLPKSPPTALNNVKSLEFSITTLRNVEEVSGAVYLITNCPKLQELSMDCDSVLDVVEPVVEFLEAQSITSFGAAKLLQKVEMCYFKGAEMQMEFMKFILASAPVLEKITMLMIPHEFLLCADTQMMEEKMKQFPRASPNVRFIFVEY
ncbi:F-box/FBD/LRR-repeat protein At1g13570-like [Lycium barbarum]|uniref:F-box/FBD/LRR-repeat protein At1g13570-like n=1 Tax=Lycium barbarum TaxID=112863 RepID=UPI00293F5DF8|nr:F-box/FBD/LRR-repeat protein At1g13570-like [Lycium barbarum]XP_060185882.1 F-box/FBD/LRR-repeat protein At1g13570-like [Lycium barbarum]XP_060185883.1 F-box/FBD/LRR-repeat protein At1g13570-like [Lycium barbarum]XP_060185884.1 F-box/FBD/LRR-repeat protein At1g13570-like [Lycium barbarum]